jgi:hypothetical protein
MGVYVLKKVGLLCYIRQPMAGWMYLGSRFPCFFVFKVLSGTGKVLISCVSDGGHYHQVGTSHTSPA